MNMQNNDNTSSPKGGPDMSNIHTSTIHYMEDADIDRHQDAEFCGEDAYRISCTVCGTVATYAGEQFTAVEAMRHDRVMNELAAKS